MSSPSNWYTMPTVFLTTPLMRGAATLSITGPIRAPANGAANGKNPLVCCPFPKYQTPRRIYVFLYIYIFSSFNYDSSSLYCDLNVYVLYFNDKEPSCSK